MKKTYTSAVAELVGFHTNDIVTSSPLTVKNGGDGDEYLFGSLFGN